MLIIVQKLGSHCYGCFNNLQKLLGYEDDKVKKLNKFICQQSWNCTGNAINSYMPFLSISINVNLPIFLIHCSFWNPPNFPLLIFLFYFYQNNSNITPSIKTKARQAGPNLNLPVLLIAKAESLKCNRLNVEETYYASSFRGPIAGS